MLYGFLSRHPEISLRTPEATSINRVKAFNKKEVSIFYNNLEQLLNNYSFTANRIFNTDETGIPTVQFQGKVLAKKGTKQVRYLTSWKRGKNITLVCTFSASGMYVSPMFIFPRKRLNPLPEKRGPPRAVYGCSESGWTNEELFFQYLKRFQNFVKANIEDPVLLVTDNHTTYSTLPSYQFCKANGMVLLTSLPHTSHNLQPLDVFF